MNFLIKYFFGFAIAFTLVFGAILVSKAMAGGGKKVEYIPIFLNGQPAPPSLFDLLYLNTPIAPPIVC